MLARFDQLKQQNDEFRQLITLYLSAGDWRGHSEDGQERCDWCLAPIVIVQTGNAVTDECQHDPNCLIERMSKELDQVV